MFEVPLMVMRVASIPNAACAPTIAVPKADIVRTNAEPRSVIAPSRCLI
jgi:hypothetical protein